MEFTCGMCHHQVKMGARVCTACQGTVSRTIPLSRAIKYCAYPCRKETGQRRGRC